MPLRRRRAPVVDDEPLLGSLLAIIFFGHLRLRDVWPRSNHLSVCTFRHIMWWVFCGCLIAAGVLIFFFDIISFQKNGGDSTAYLALFGRTTCLCVCLVYGALYVQRARKRDTLAADESVHSVGVAVGAPPLLSTPLLVGSGGVGFGMANSSEQRLALSNTLLAPALRAPPFTLYSDHLFASLPYDSPRVRKQWNRRLGWGAALVLVIFFSFLALDILQRSVSPLGSSSGNLSGTAIVILNIVYTAFFGLLYATAAAVVGMHAVSCMHLELALDSMRERLRRVSPASSQLAAAISAPGHDEGDEHDDDDDDDGYHALVDSSGRVVSSARDSEAVDAIGMSHPFASVDIRAVRKAMALKHGTQASAAAATAAAAAAATGPPIHHGPPSSAASVAAAAAASSSSSTSSSSATLLSAPEVFSLNGAGGTVHVPLSSDDDAATATSRVRLSSTLSAHSSAPSSVSLQAYSPPVAPAPVPHNAATPTFSSTAPVFSFAPPFAGGSGSGGGNGNGRASGSGGGGGGIDEPPTPLTVLDSVSMDLVHFHKALRRHNKTWGRLVGIVLLVFTLLLVLNAIWTLSSHKHARPTPTPTPHPNATALDTGADAHAYTDAAIVALASASVAGDVEMYKNLAVALLTLFVLIPAIVLPPSLIAEGINKILVTMYIFADDWAASSQQSAGLSVATAASVATAIAPLALPLPAKGAAPHSPSSSSPPSMAMAASPTAAATAITAAAAAAASAARASANDLIVVRITALMSRVSSLISVDALSARLASVSVSHSMAGGVLFVLAAAALVLIPELISDSPFAH